MKSIDVNEKCLVGSRVVNTSKYQSENADFFIYYIELDRGILEVCTPIVNICDTHDIKAEISELIGYCVDHIGPSNEGHEYQILFESGLKIVAEYYFDFETSGGSICYEPSKKGESGFSISLNML